MSIPGPELCLCLWPHALWEVNHRPQAPCW